MVCLQVSAASLLLDKKKGSVVSQEAKRRFAGTVQIIKNFKENSTPATL